MSGKVRRSVIRQCLVIVIVQAKVQCVQRLLSGADCCADANRKVEGRLAPADPRVPFLMGLTLLLHTMGNPVFFFLTW